MKRERNKDEMGKKGGAHANETKKMRQKVGMREFTGMEHKWEKEEVCENFKI